LIISNRVEKSLKKSVVNELDFDENGEMLEERITVTTMHDMSVGIDSENGHD
jgi:hypothetical protein